jgi:hypothetical protein
MARSTTCVRAVEREENKEEEDEGDDEREEVDNQASRHRMSSQKSREGGIGMNLYCEAEYEAHTHLRLDLDRLAPEEDVQVLAQASHLLLHTC